MEIFLVMFSPLVKNGLNVHIVTLALALALLSALFCPAVL